MRAIVLMVATLLSATPALATADFSCSFSDQNLTFRVYVAYNRSTGQIGNINAQLEIRAKNVPSDLRKLEFQPEHLVQQWLYRGDLKLMFSLGDILLAIEMHDPAGGSGTYKLTIDDGKTTDSIELHGSAECG